jgi:hypothetical protein
MGRRGEKVSMIIGICGLIGTGKGTVADILVEQGFVKHNFADKLKDGVSTIFGWDRAMLEGDTDESRQWREQKDSFWSSELDEYITPRAVLQMFGTDCMRDGFHKDIWVSLLKQQLIANPEYNYVVPDVRFENEIEMLRSIGGQVWEVKRNGDPEWLIEYETTGVEPTSVHPSEWCWVKPAKDFVVHNDGTIDDLRDQVLGRLLPSRF